MANIKFGTDGWRAIMSEDFTFENVQMVVQGIASYINKGPLKNQGLVIGYDTRFQAERFAEKAAQVLVANGIKVYMVDKATPTPVTAYAILMQKSAGALMFTASHNPPEYNGIKFIPEYAGPATLKITKALEDEIAIVLQTKAVKTTDYQEALKSGKVEVIDPRPEYEVQLEKVVDFKLIGSGNLKVCYDPMCGCGIGWVGQLLKKAGCEVHSINECRDPLFGGSLPEPTESKLGRLIELVKTTNSDLGLANDGDADRFGVIDSEGRYYTPNQVISLLLLHLVKNRKYTGGVVRTVATTHLLDKIAKKYGLEIHETPVGFKYIGELMLEKDIIIGGEESGGLSIKGHIPEKDGILANCLMAELCVKEGKPLKGILAEMEEEFGVYYSKRLDLTLPEEKKQQIIAAMKTATPAKIGDFTVVEKIEKDGVKLILTGDNWILFRPSGTEPLLRVYLESTNANEIVLLEKSVKEMIENF